MLFSSITFIYYFLPLLVIIYFILPKKIRNLILLIFSLLFYFLGEPKYIIILILSCIINYYLSKLLNNKYKKIFLIITLLYNIGQLLYFKYTDFFITNLNNIVGTDISLLHVIMPIGISFFTFQNIGYIADVYNKKHEPCNSLINYMTYICLFPQLIAGPIVRYTDIAKSLEKREESFKNFSQGIKRFLIGLSKKILIADVLAEFASSILTETVLSSWLKPISYTLQVYFDFSGYSDMAIGLCLMFGFKIPENFNYPLIASSITDFWRRWHISLSSWFKDYVYIPLGGNRVNKIKWFRNIFIVWFLTGFWHGASWNFIIWGLYFGIILVIEKIFLKKFLDKTKVTKHIYTLLIVIISFLIFGSENLNDIANSLKNMFMLNNIDFSNNEILYQLRNYLGLFIIAIISATPLLKTIILKIKETKFKTLINILEPVTYIILLTLVTSFLIDSSFSPFLYFRF